MKTILVILVTLFTANVTAGAYAENKGFSLMGEKQTGSRIARKVITSNVPFYKSYEQLNEEEKTAVRSDYQGLAAVDVPPYPTEGMKVISNALIDAHKRLNKPGELFVIARVSDTGKVSKVEVFKTTGKRMSEIAGAVFFNAQFNPGTCAGEPCESEFLLNWKLEKYGEGLSGLKNQVTN